MKENERQNERENYSYTSLSDIGYVILNLVFNLYFINQYPNLKPQIICMSLKFLVPVTQISFVSIDGTNIKLRLILN